MRARIAALAVSLLCISIASARLLSQTTEQNLSFEVASIKPSPVATSSTTILCHGMDAAMPLSSPPTLGQCVLGHRALIDIIVYAYEVPYLAITGGPEWTKSERFDIQAKAEDPTQTSRAKFQLMFRSLMVDRFKLVFHREIREGAGYEMVIAKSGPKLDEASGKRVQQGIFVSAASHTITGNGGTLGRLAIAIGFQVTAVVVDKTGLSGLYDFRVRWSPQPGEPGFSTAQGVIGPSLFAAIQEQMGLRLQSKKIPIEMFVIDSAEKPAMN